MYKFAHDLGFCIRNRAPVGPVHLKSFFLSVFIIWEIAWGCLVGKQPRWLVKMKVFVPSRSSQKSFSVTNMTKSYVEVHN